MVMAGGHKHIGLIRRAMGPALAMIVIGSFAGHAVAGPNGLLAWGGATGGRKCRPVPRRRPDSIHKIAVV